MIRHSIAAQRGPHAERLRGPVRRRVLALAAALTLASCTRPITQFVAIIESDTLDTVVRTLRVRCAYDWDGIAPITPHECNYEWRRGCSQAQVALPASFGIIHDSSRSQLDPSRQRLTFVIEDMANQDHRRIVRATPTTDLTTHFRLRLTANCGLTAANSATHPCPGGAAMCTRARACEELGRQSGRALTCGDDMSCRSIDLATLEMSTTAIPAPPNSCDAGRD